MNQPTILANNQSVNNERYNQEKQLKAASGAGKPELTHLKKDTQHNVQHNIPY
jgi:hypothetical protein